MFKTLHINVQFLEALAQKPNYESFVKELFPNKRKLEEVTTVKLSEEYSTILTNKLLKKKRDLGGFINHYTIWGIDEKALADLGVIINLMPYKIFQKLGIGEPKPHDLEDKVKVPLIFGRPFLAIYQPLIDVKDGWIVLRVGQEEVVFKLQDTMRYSMDFDDTRYFVLCHWWSYVWFYVEAWMKDEQSKLLEEEPSNVMVK